MANPTAEKYVVLQEMLKVITEARQAYERLSEIWAKELANPIGPHTTHLSSPITPMTPSQSPQLPDLTDLLLVDPEPLVETMKSSGPFIESLKHASVLQVPGSVSDVFLVHRVDSHVKEVEELPQESTNSNEKNVAHQVLAEMPLGVTSKEKQRKSLKAWKFKFKTSFKRSKSMDVKFFSVEEIAWYTRDSKEVNWGCVNKEFKEAVAGCGKKIINRFKLVHETSKPAVYDRPFQIRVWDSGGSSFERVDEESSGDDKSSEVIATETVVKLMHKALMDNKYSFVDESSGKDVKVLEAQQGFRTQVCSNFDVKAFGLENYGWGYKRQMLILTRSYVVDVLSLDDGVFMTAKRLLISPRGNQVWEPGGVLIERDKWKGLEKCYERGRLMRLMHWLSSMWWKETKFKEIDRLDVCSTVGTGMWLVIYSCEKIQKLLLCYHSLKVQEKQLFPEDNVKFPEVSIISMRKGLVCDKEKKRLRNVKAVGCLCDLDQVKSLDEEEFVGFTEFSKLQLAMEFLLLNFRIFMNTRLLHDKINSVFVALRVTLALLVVFEYIKAIRTRYEKAEINFTGKFAESIIVAVIDEREDIETACVLFKLSLNEGTHTLSHLVKDYDDGRRITWFKLTLNSLSQQITGSTPQSNEVQRETKWNDVTQTEAVWGAKHTSFGYVENPLAEFCAYEVYHPPRPPELSGYKEDEESTAIGSVSAIVGENESKVQKFSSLRTRMF